MNGVVKPLNSVRLEDGTTYDFSSLLMVPDARLGGYIKGTFPVYTVQNGEHFIATIGCQYGANNCNMYFTLDYMIVGSPTPQNLFQYTERYEGLLRSVDIDLSALAGQEVKFILTISDNSGVSGAFDRAVWVAPHIDYVGVTSTTPIPTPTNTPDTSGATAFDFTADPAVAVWTNASGAVTFDGTDPSVVGVAKKVTTIHLEDNSTEPRASLVLVPEDIDGGYIQGVFPAFAVLSGDHFKTTIGCEYGATNCYARFILDFQIAGDPTLYNLINYSERYEGMLRDVDIDLSALAGQSVKFILNVDEDNGTSGALDRTVWIAPRITR